MIARWKAWLAHRRAIGAMVDKVCRSLSEVSPLHVGDKIDVAIKRGIVVLMVMHSLAGHGIVVKLGQVRREVKRWEWRERRRLRRAR